MIGPDGALLRLSDASRSFTGQSQSRSIDDVLGPRIANGGQRSSLHDFGVHTIRHQTDRHELFLAVDCGPLGIGSNPGHGHADALSFSLYVDGRPLLVDPGTYLYVDTPAAMWFKLPEAHNTIHWPGSPAYQLARFFRWTRYPAAPEVLPSH